MPNARISPAPDAIVPVEEILTRSPAETVAAGRRFAARLKTGDTVAFFGDLGSGKTTMIKGIAEGLQVKETVRSPSFIVATEYDGVIASAPVKVYHIDLYRLKGGAELADIGFRDYVRGDGVTLIEWAERAGLALPPGTVRVELQVEDENSRRIRITA